MLALHHLLQFLANYSAVGEMRETSLLVDSEITEFFFVAQSNKRKGVRKMEQDRFGGAGSPGILAEIDKVIVDLDNAYRLCELSAEQPGLAGLRSALEEMKSLRERVAQDLADGKKLSVKDLKAMIVALSFFESLVKLIRSFVNYLFSQARVVDESWAYHRAVAAG